jgi:hypothetical protein
MTAAQQLDLRSVRADLGQHRGHELLGGELAGQAQLDPLRDHGQVGGVMRALPERAEHGRRRLHRDQPLALDVADDEPAAKQRGHDLVQVTTDLRVRRG